jgi:hypothetical protein
VITGKNEENYVFVGEKVFQKKKIVIESMNNVKIPSFITITKKNI